MTSAIDHPENGGTALTSTDLATWVQQLTHIDTNAPDPELINQITQLERLKAACAAAQATLTDTFVQSQTAGLTARARDERTRRSITAQIGIARRDSPLRGNRHVGTAKALLHEMPHTYAALQTGDLSEWRATLIIRETACLSKEDRQQVDKELAPHLPGLGDKHIAHAAATIGQRLDPGSYVNRARKANGDRRVTVRPAPDTMTYVTALLPVAWGVAVYAALTKHVTTTTATGDTRTPGQQMADEFVRRITNPDTASSTASGTGAATGAGSGSNSPTRTEPAPPDAAPHHPAPTDPAGISTSNDEETPVTTHGTDHNGTHSTDQPARTNTTNGKARLGDRTTDIDTQSGDRTIADTDNGDTDHNNNDERASRDNRSTTPAGAIAGHTGDRNQPPDPEDIEDTAIDEDENDSELGEIGVIPPGIGVTINLIMTDRTLFDGDNEPAILTGYGPIPAPLARKLIRGAGPTTKTWIRRLYTDPTTGQLITADTRRRTFTHPARQFLITRDQTCRTPFCDAPIKHADHITPRRTGGPTKISNGQGLCERCNYTKEQPGWKSHTQPNGTITITTPTGHTINSPTESSWVWWRV